MGGIASFVCNPFQENTLIVHASNGDCAIIDPGCYSKVEREEIKSYVEKHKLNPIMVVNTHCHIDHVLGNYFVTDLWKIPLSMHEGELPVLKSVATYSDSMGIKYDLSPDPNSWLNEGDEVVVGDQKFDVLFTPGHSPASICLYNKAEGYLVGGDVLFLDSIGRTDLPGGDMDTLLNSIKTKLFTLPNDTVVYPGHGPTTTIGREKKHNPFLQ